jgi:hypothetical protein
MIKVTTVCAYTATGDRINELTDKQTVVVKQHILLVAEYTGDNSRSFILLSNGTYLYVKEDLTTLRQGCSLEAH